jgi:hypothetical protein
LVDFRLHFGHLRLHLFDEFPQLQSLVVRGLRLRQRLRRDNPSQEKSGGKNVNCFRLHDFSPPLIQTAERIFSRLYSSLGHWSDPFHRLAMSGPLQLLAWFCAMA